MSTFTFNQAALISYTTDEWGNVKSVGIHPLDGPEMPEDLEDPANDAYAEVWERANGQQWAFPALDYFPKGVEFDPV